MKQRPGFSLVEMIVVLFILAIVGDIVIQFIIKTNQNYQIQQSQSVVQRDLALALDRFNRVLRSTTRIIETTAINVKVHGYPNVADVAPSEINLFLNGTIVNYTVIAPTGTAPNYTYNPASAVTYKLLSRVTNTGAEPLFLYYDETNALLAQPVAIADVKVVEFLPRATDTANSLPKSIPATTRVTLRNFKTNL